MRPRIQPQGELEFPISKRALTQQYYARDQAISKILDQVPEILALAHGDLKHALEQVTGCEKDGSRSRYTSDQVRFDERRWVESGERRRRGGAAPQTR